MMHRFIGSVMFLMAAGCGEAPPQQPIVKEPTQAAQTSKEEIAVEIRATGMGFEVKNLGKELRDSKLTTFPPAITGTILRMTHSYELVLGTISPGQTITILRSDLHNARRGDALADSKLVVGVILFNGKIGGQQQGAMYERDGTSWRRAPKSKTWSAIPDNEPQEELKVDFFHGENPLFVLLLNKENNQLIDIGVQIISDTGQTIASAKVIPPLKPGDMAEPIKKFVDKGGNEWTPSGKTVQVRVTATVAGKQKQLTTRIELGKIKE